MFHRARHGDDDALRGIIESNLRFVAAVAREYDSRKLSVEELISEGNVGLIEAARRFDPGRGNRFITYAVWWIRNAIRTALDQCGQAVRAPTTQGPDVRRLRTTAESLAHRLGRAPTDAEIDRHTPLSTARIRQARRRAGTDLSLDAPFADARTLADALATRATPADDALIDSRRRSDVDLALQQLPERERFVVRACFGFDRQEPATLQEIGRVLGVSRERARQIKESGLARLRSGAHDSLRGWARADGLLATAASQNAHPTSRRRDPPCNTADSGSASA